MAGTATLHASKVGAANIQSAQQAPTGGWKFGRRYLRSDAAGAAQVIYVPPPAPDADLTAQEHGTLRTAHSDYQAAVLDCPKPAQRLIAKLLTQRDAACVHIGMLTTHMQLAEDLFRHSLANQRTHLFDPSIPPKLPKLPSAADVLNSTGYPLGIAETFHVPPNELLYKVKFSDKSGYRKYVQPDKLAAVPVEITDAPAVVQAIPPAFLYQLSDDFMPPPPQ